ncbi:MAG: hypothetical protein ACRD1P_11545 [Thermoanaerobaculia bacterium]
MGQPHEEEYFYEGWRDAGQGEPRPKDVISDPSCSPLTRNPADQQKMDDLFCRFEAALKKPLVFFVKKPSFVEPPFFAKPLIKTKCGLQVAPGATAVIFDRLIEDRQRAVVTAFGLDVAPLAPIMNCQLEFWFQAANAQANVAGEADVIPLFDDQTPTAYGGSTPVKYGRTTVLPGSVEIPWCLLSNGLQFGVRGRTRLQMLVENKSGVTVTIRGVLGFYQYWSSAPAGAAEWASGDLQL